MACLSLATLLAPSQVSAQDGVASPVVQTSPIATSAATELAATTPSTPQVVGEAGGGVGNGDGDFDNIGSFTTFKIVPDLGTIAPGGSTQWVVDFSGFWGLDFSGQALSLTLQFSWAGTPSDLLCAGEQCSGSPWSSGPTTVAQNYNAAYSFGGRLLVTWPNPTAPGLYHVYAIMTATSPGTHPIVSTAQKTLNFAVMPSLTPSPSPTALTGSPVPTEDVGSEQNQTPTAPASTEAARSEPTTDPTTIAQGGVRALPNTGTTGTGDSPTEALLWLLGATLVALIASRIVRPRRR